MTPMGVPRKPTQPPSAEASAFLEQAMDQYGKATYNFAYRLTGNEADARDLTQDAFVRVYRAWRSFQPGTSFLSWIYRIMAGQLGEPLSKALGQLSPEQRQVVVLADIEEYSYQEIADIMGCSIGTVRSRLHRARALLRRLVTRAQQEQQ